MAKMQEQVRDRGVSRCGDGQGTAMPNVEEQLRVLHNLRQAFTSFWADRHGTHPPTATFDV